MMAATGSLEAQGDRTIVLQLASPFGLVLEALGKPGGNVPVIMPARLADTPASTGITDPTGSGPYVMKKDEWNAGSKVVYTRFAGYKPREEPADGFAGGKVAHFDRVEWIYIPDASTAINSLLNGEIDFVQFPQLDYIPDLKRNRDIKLAIPEGIAQVTGYARLNHLVAPTNDPRIRKAMQLLVDQSDVMNAVGAGDLRTPTWSFFVAGGPYATDAGTDEIRRPNPERAKQLMSEAGYKGERVVVLHATDIAGNHLSSLVIEDAWKRAGFNVDVQNMDWSTVVARRASRAEPDKGGWNMFVAFPSGFDSHLPSTHPYIANNCDENYPGWSCDAGTTPLLKAFPAEPDFAKRQAIAAQIQRRGIADVPCILWGQWAQPSAYRANLDGLLNVGVPVFWNVRRV
jgi:peptide/nickel transport system substrate-binding protein